MPGRSLVRAILAPFRRALGASADLAEDLSDAGHGPQKWREDSLEPNPYAGEGPDREPERKTVEAAAEGRPPE